MHATHLLSLFACISSAFSAPPSFPQLKRSSGGGSSGLPDPGQVFNLTGTSKTPNPVVSPQLLNQLLLAPDAVARIQILANQNNSDYFKFNYNPQAVASHVALGQGGQGNLADRKSFPALIGHGVAMSMGFLNPCGMNTPHIHPRATEFLNIVSGGPVKTGFLAENGFTEQVSTVLSKYEAAILPQGAIHYEFNDNCEPAIFVAAFSSEDPGLSSIANNFFSLNPDIVDANLGYPRQIDQYNLAKYGPHIPLSFALGAKECLKRCGIKYQPENNPLQTYRPEGGYTDKPDP